MREVRLTDIQDEILVCPYCMNDVSSDSFGCCGESSAHFETAYVLNDDEVLLDSEIKIINE